MRSRRTGERGMALMLALVVLFVLSIMGLTLLYSSTAEMQIAGAETTLNKTFYAADSGVQYALAQGRQTVYTGPGYTDPQTGVTYPSFWGFTLPEQNIDAKSSPRALSVRVTPMRQIDLQQAPYYDMQKGTTTFDLIGWHLDSYARDVALQSQRQIAVDVTIGPVPWTPAGQ
jgi:hypothetical protein